MVPARYRNGASTAETSQRTGADRMTCGRVIGPCRFLCLLKWVGLAAGAPDCHAGRARRPSGDRHTAAAITKKRARRCDEN
jgi:hypothetical protein